MHIPALPDNQGWIAGGWHFRVSNDGGLTIARPGETNGVSFLYPAQSTPPVPSSGFRLFGDELGRLSWIDSAKTTKFDNTANTGDRIYTLPNKSGTIALTSDTTIAVSTPTGLSATSGVGTIALSYASGYAIPTTAKQSTWDGKQDALGFTPLNKAGDTLSPADGTGFLGFPSQSASPSAPSSGFRLFANSSNAFSWRGQNSYLRVFDGTANTADRTYTLPDKSGTIALLSDIPLITSTPPNPASYSDGQLWVKPTDNGMPGTAGFWVNKSNLYWLSVQTFIATTFFANVSTSGYGSSNTRISLPFPQNSLYVSHLRHTFSSLATNNASNYWSIFLRPDSGTQTTLLTSLTTTFDGTDRTVILDQVMTGFITWAKGGLGVFASITGTPSNISGNAVVVARIIHP